MLGDAVNLRLTDDAVTTLAPGERRRVVLDTFSRGWARYRMLEKGRYRIQLTYVPAWDDEELRRRRVGRVESNALAVHVRKAAPATVRRDGRKIMAELSRKDDRLVVELVGTGDLPVHVNTAIGPRLSRTATVVWGVWWKDQSVEFQHPEATTPDKPFTEVAAGDRVTVASLPIDAVFAHKALEAIPADETVTLVARYTSVLSRSFVLGGPPGSRKKILPRGTTAAEYATTLPLTLYSGSPPTNKLEITRPR
jgi:hypothetical protein